MKNFIYYLIPVMWLSLHPSCLFAQDADSTNVGINIKNPQRTLDINGDLLIRGRIFDTNNSAGKKDQILVSGKNGTATWTDLDSSIKIKNKGINATRIIVGKNGNADFQTIHEALASIKNSSDENWYKVLINPGTYLIDKTIVTPPYTIIEGRTSGTVTIESIEGASMNYLIDQTHTSVLKNLTLRHNGGTSYVIHYDSPGLKNATTYNEHLDIILANGTNIIIGGGSYDNFTSSWNACTFTGTTPNAAVACHDKQKSDFGMTLEFRNCSFNCIVALGNVGGFGNSSADFTNCYFTKPIGHWYTSHLLSDSEELMDWNANRNSWIITGGGNHNFRYKPSVNAATDGQYLVVQAVNIDEDFHLYGDIDSVFGNYRYQPASPRLPASYYSYGDVRDIKVGQSINGGKDVIQLWKRLGNCQASPKTLFFKFDNTEESLLLTEDYTATQPSEEEIISELNNQLTNVFFTKESATSNNYDLIYTDEVLVATTGSSDILANEWAYIDPTDNRAYKLSSNSYVAGYDAWGIAFDNCIQDQPCRIWMGDYILEHPLPDGLYGLDENHALTSSISPIVSVKSDVVKRIAKDSQSSLPTLVESDMWNLTLGQLSPSIANDVLFTQKVKIDSENSSGLLLTNTDDAFQLEKNSTPTTNSLSFIPSGSANKSSDISFYDQNGSRTLQLEADSLISHQNHIFSQDIIWNKAHSIDNPETLPQFLVLNNQNHFEPLTIGRNLHFNADNSSIEVTEKASFHVSSGYNKTYDIGAKETVIFLGPEPANISFPYEDREKYMQKLELELHNISKTSTTITLRHRIGESTIRLKKYTLLPGYNTVYMESYIDDVHGNYQLSYTISSEDFPHQAVLTSTYFTLFEL